MLSRGEAETYLVQVDIDTVEKFEALRQTEKDYFTDMVKRCKDSGATLIICQWGFDDEANHLLMANDLPCTPQMQAACCLVFRISVLVSLTRSMRLHSCMCQTCTQAASCVFHLQRPASPCWLP